MRVLAVGECMAELSPLGAADTFRLGFAGDTFNTAWYLARLRPDIRVAFFSAVGTDALSARMREAIAASGIDGSAIATVPNRSVGLYLISLDKGERRFSYWRGQSAARHLADDPAALRAAMGAADVVYFSGITLAILAPDARQTFLTAVRDARAAGKTIAFDPNLRPGLWPDTAQMTQAVMEGAAISDIALPSFEDEAQWFGDEDPDATATRYAAAGAGTVIVKNGPAEVRYLQAGARGTVPVASLTEVVDTTAAGDSFNAAILADLGRAAPLHDTIAAACAVSRQVVLGAGALVPVDPLAPR